MFIINQIIKGTTNPFFFLMKIILYKNLKALQTAALQCQFLLYKMIRVMKHAFYTDTLENLQTSLKQTIDFGVLMQYTMCHKLVTTDLVCLDHNLKGNKMAGLDEFCKRVKKVTKGRFPQVIELAALLKDLNSKMR